LASDSDIEMSDENAKSLAKIFDTRASLLDRDQARKNFKNRLKELTLTTNE